MAVCPSCGHEVAADAWRCPKCGGKTRYARRLTRWITNIVVVVLLGVLAVGGLVWRNHQEDIYGRRYLDCIARHPDHLDLC